MAETHTYERDPQSGAGNCWCGRALEHVMHPHDFLPRASDERLCVCSRRRDESPHPVRGTEGEYGPGASLS
jgi:hypothetical protein